MMSTPLKEQPLINDIDDCIETAVDEVMNNIIGDEDYSIFNLELKNQKSSDPYFIQIPITNLISDNENISVVFHIWDTKYHKKTLCNQKEDRPMIFHNHDFYEISYVYQGSVTNYLKDGDINLDKSRVLLMNPYAYHKTKILDRETLMFNIIIRKEFSAEILTAPYSSDVNLINIFLDTSLGLSPLQPYLSFENTPQIDSIMHQIIIEYYRKDDYYQQFLYSKLIELWTQFARQMQTRNNTDLYNSNYPEDIKKIISYIWKNYSTITLTELSDKFGLSLCTLSNAIHEFTGHKFSDIISIFKIRNAIGYLIHSYYSLEKIVELVGYNDVSYFSKVFKKKMGISPGQYRNRYNETQGRQSRRTSSC